MKPQGYEETTHQPLTTDALIQERVATLIGRAVRRQLWVLFLDEDSVQLPTLVPLEGLPSRPGPHLQPILRNLAEVADSRRFVFVLERFGGVGLTESDVAWARALHDGCGECGFEARAILLSHRGGVRWIAQDDYRF